MPLRNYILSFIIFSFWIGLTGQTDPDFKWDLASPVDHPIRLSGTFGELRSNHFHAGIDIKKSGNQHRDAIRSVDDGFISRISVRPGGYGNAIYINHRNGYTTVYAHLHRFNPEIAKYVKEHQYKQEQFAVELYPKDSVLLVNKGEKIGEMGNTGSSFGAHLHFEIRKTGQQIPLNPLHFGLNLYDNIGPDPKAIHIHYMDSDHQIFKRERIALKRRNDGIYYPVEGEILKVGAWRIGLAVEVRDKMNASPNNNGIYKMSTMVDTQLIHSFKFDQIPFSTSKYINAHIDYEFKTNQKKSLHRSYLLPGNYLNIYKNGLDRGIIKIFEKKARDINILVGDAKGNLSKINFRVLRDTMMTVSEKSHHTYFLPYDEASRLEIGGLHIDLPEGALYEDLRMHFLTSLDSSKGYFSPIYHIHKQSTPLHKKMEIRIDGREVPEHKKDKTFIAYCDEGEIINCGGKWKGSQLVSSVSKFGNYAIFMDEMAPTIEALNFAKTVKNQKQFTFIIDDNLKSRDEAKGISFEGQIDGNWVLMEFDAKSKRLRHYFEPTLAKGEHTFSLKVNDSMGNTSFFTDTFLYYPSSK